MIFLETTPRTLTKTRGSAHGYVRSWEERRAESCRREMNTASVYACRSGLMRWRGDHYNYVDLTLVKSSQVNLLSQTLLGQQREKKTKQKSSKPCTEKKKNVSTSQQNKECLHKSRFNHAFTVSFNTHTIFTFLFRQRSHFLQASVGFSVCY